MTELLLQQAVAANPAQQELQQRVQPQSLEIVGSIEQQGIAIEDKEGVAASLDVIRTEFGLDDSAFEDPKNSLMLTAVANRLNQIDTSESGEFGAKAAELEYVADLVMSIAGPKTAYGDQHREAMDSVERTSDERQKAAYEKYTQPEVTADMDAFIRGEALDELRKRLGVTEMQPFEVKVLSVDFEDNETNYGLIPGAKVEGEWSQEKQDAADKEREYGKDYLKGLMKNGESFVAELGREAAFGPAWVTTFEDGTKYLCLTLPTAEKVLYQEEERADYYNDGDRERDLAFVKHEFTHTQASLLSGDEIGLGIALEELRAEHFSGDKHGYTDIKKFFAGVKMLTGYSPKMSFERDGKAFDRNEFVTDIARNLGLSGLVDCMAAIPLVYVEDEQANPYVKAIAQHNGGLNGQFEKMFERIVAEQGSAQVEARIDRSVDALYEDLKDSEYVTVESWAAYGGIKPLARLVIENFRRRYPDKSDRLDYFEN